MEENNKKEEAKIRIKFETLSQRLNKINVDILHKNSSTYYLQSKQSLPSTGELGCFLLDELNRLKTHDISAEFKKYIYFLIFFLPFHSHFIIGFS